MPCNKFTPNPAALDTHIISQFQRVRSLRVVQWGASGSIAPTGCKEGVSWAVVISELEWERAHIWVIPAGRPQLLTE